MIAVTKSNKEQFPIRIDLGGLSNYLTKEALKELKKRIDEFIIEEGIE